MALTNAYASLASVKAAVGVTTTEKDAEVEAAIEAASRHIDAHCGKGRKFWQDASVVARTYYPSESWRCGVDDISTVTGLVVKTDDNDDGTFETTLVINTDFIVTPVNAAAEFPVRPFDTIQLLDGSLSSFPRLSSGRAPLQVTAKFGWPAVPDAVERACVFQAKNIFKAPELYWGILQADDGTALRVPAIDPIARALLEPFVRYVEVDDGS